MFKKLFGAIDIFGSHLSAAEWAWRIITFAVVAGGGTTAGFLSKSSELFSTAGPLGWMFVAVCTSGAIALIFFFIKLGNRQSAEANYLQVLSQPKSGINPLAENFADQIIYLPDLFLPQKQLHSNKQFKRCKLVGPGAIAILGGTLNRCEFDECGTLIVIPEDSILTGVLVLENCMH